jgi:hypothetical protein
MRASRSRGWYGGGPKAPPRFRDTSARTHGLFCPQAWRRLSRKRRSPASPCASPGAHYPCRRGAAAVHTWSRCAPASSFPRFLYCCPALVRNCRLSGRLRSGVSTAGGRAELSMADLAIDVASIWQPAMVSPSCIPTVANCGPLDFDADIPTRRGAAAAECVDEVASPRAGRTTPPYPSCGFFGKGFGHGYR